jgi:hypothetical protein
MPFNEEVLVMPKKDGTGPAGKGPLTGRGSGLCIMPLDSTEVELGFLRNQERALREQLDVIKTRIKSLEKTVCRS